MRKTIVVQIGNSDDKLTQKRWSAFCREIYAILRQYACFVAVFDEALLVHVFRDIKHQRHQFNQDSVAVVIGDTEFV